MDWSGELLTQKEVISYLRTSKSAFHRAIKAKKIPEGIRVIGKPLWPKRAIEKLIHGKELSN